MVWQRGEMLAAGLSSAREGTRGLWKPTAGTGIAGHLLLPAEALALALFLPIFHSLSPLALFYLYKTVHFLCTGTCVPSGNRRDLSPPWVLATMGLDLAPQSVGQGPHLSFSCPYLPDQKVIVGVGGAENTV